MNSNLVAVTAVGTVRGRVSRPELCLAKVEADLGSIVEGTRSLDLAPFKSISIVIHLGTDFIQPRVWGIDKGSGVLETAVGIPMAEVRRQPSDHVCLVVKKAALEALIAGFNRYGISKRSLAAALRELPENEDEPS